jgi:hypothetical protein
MKLSLGLFCALGMSVSACGKKEEKTETKPATAAAKADSEATAKTPTAPIEAAKPATPEPAVDPDEAPADEAPAANAKLELSSKSMGKDFETSLGNGTITAFGTEYPAKDLCNESTIMNPDTVEVFETGSPDQLVVLCAGSLDGETNVVTLFEKDKKPRTESVSPPESSHRVEDKTLKTTVQALLDAK